MSKNNFPVKSIILGDVAIENYSIVKQTEAPAVNYAATELQKYIKLSCGAILPICEKTTENTIILKIEQVDSAFTDSFKISVKDNNLELSGNNERAIIYAVYTFLEKYIGWRWYTKDAERVIEADSVTVSNGTVWAEKPILEYRYPMYHTCKQSYELCLKQKINAGVPATIEGAGESLSYNGFVHTLASLLPKEKYFEEHPEYFAFYDGERHDTQPCLSNPDVLKIVTEEVLKRLRENPQRITSVSFNDNLFYCTCPECAKIDKEEDSHMGTLIRFVNAIADEVKKEFPDIMVDTLAYQQSRKPPKLTVPRDNVIIRLCSIECCFNHSFDDPNCSTEDKNCRENIKFRQEIVDWNKICNYLYIWDYGINFAHYLAPFPHYKTMLKNMRFFANHHAKGILEQGNYNGDGADFNEMHSYLAAKLLWNPYTTDEEYEELIKDFLEGFYGKGWEYIYKYLQILEESVDDRHFNFEADVFRYLDKFANRIDEANELWDKAESLAENEEELTRIRKTRLSVLYCDVLLRYEERMNKSPESKAKLIQDNKLLYKRFFEYGLRLCEWYTLVEDQPDLTKRVDEWVHDRPYP